jgi:hypothetical protein
MIFSFCQGEFWTTLFQSFSEREERGGGVVQNIHKERVNCVPTLPFQMSRL